MESSNQIFHILSRGVDKRQIFMDDHDRFRFVYSLFKFNDKNPVLIWNAFNKDPGLNDIVSHNKDKIVNIHTFCLMPNHYHLMLSPIVEDGVSLFMRKLNIGYSKYFNQRYKRTGALFEGRYKSITLNSDAHFFHLPFYIHFNPLDLKYPEWRENKISNPSKALEFLKSYRWSSHLDYCGIKNFPNIISQELLSDVFENTSGYVKRVNEQLMDLNLEYLSGLTLENLDNL